MLDQTFHAAQARGADEDFRFRRDSHRRVASILRFERKHPAEQLVLPARRSLGEGGSVSRTDGHLPRGDLVSGMRLQSWIVDASYFSMLREEVRHCHRVLRMRAHPPWQCAHPAQDQPAIERRGDCAAFVLNAADALEKFAIIFRHHDPAENIAMAAEIFCGRMKNKISAEIERPLQHWRPRVIANAERAGVVNNFGDMSIKSACSPQRWKISRSNRDVP